MAKSRKSKPKPQLDPNSRMLQLGELALDEIERRILDRTATSQELTTLAKLGSEKTILENERLRKEIDLMKAKEEALISATRVEQLYSEALKAFTAYSGQGSDDDYQDVL